MTFILDPGNAVNSYSDGAVRQWQATAGLWKGDAKDTSASTHPSGWVSGQLWSTTASQWQTQYNSEVTLYNNEVAAYNAALAPAAVDHLSASGASASGTFAAGLQTAATITFDRTGQWTVIARNDMTDTSFGYDSHGKVHLIVNGTDVANSEQATGGAGQTWTGTTPGITTYWQGSATSGQTASVQIAAEDSGGGARNATGHIEAYFNPTQANPH